MLKKISISFAAAVFGAASVSSALLAASIPEPATVTLVGPHAQQQLIVSESVDGLDVDLTRKVEFASESPDVATVDANGSKALFLC